jgi:hypothetical protein
MRLMLFAAAFFVATRAGAATNVVAVGTDSIVVPAVVSFDAHVAAPTGRVDVAGAFVREGSVVRQFTANGWEVCPTSRKLLVIQRLSGAGTAVVSDTTGDLVRLTPAYSAVVFTDASAPGSHVSVRAEGGDVTVLTSHR